MSALDKTLSGFGLLGELRPNVGGEVAVRPFRGHGRPTREESAKRNRVFVRLVADGVGLADAARSARVKPERALKLLDDPVLLQVAAGSRRAA